eukprot:2558945-Alexandrium_andersonii.AAC.1
MSASLVGSEMCIRDRIWAERRRPVGRGCGFDFAEGANGFVQGMESGSGSSPRDFNAEPRQRRAKRGAPWDGP